MRNQDNIAIDIVVTSGQWWRGHDVANRENREKDRGFQEWPVIQKSMR
jgi:hypothetical protein